MALPRAACLAAVSVVLLLPATFWPVAAVVDGEELSTIGSCTLCVSSYNLVVNHLTIENDHPKPSAGSTTDQAVAVRITGDMAAFYNSRFIGWQDTLYDHKGCTLFAKDWGSYTAQKRMSTSETSGFVFLRSNITGSGKVTTSSPDTVQYLDTQIQDLELAHSLSALQALLGRAWGPAARTVYAFSFLDKGVDPSGWGSVKDFDSEKSIFFALHKCWGPGYSAAARSKYSRTLSSKQAAQFTYYSFIGASDWLGPDPAGPMTSYSLPTTNSYRPSRFNIPDAP
eukprot:SM000026S08939  [mRNA]  locus=s26:595959:598397:+ [translate_table: standard]